MFTRNLNFEIIHICKGKKLKKVQKIHFGKFWIVRYGVVLFSLYYFLNIFKILDNEMCYFSNQEKKIVFFLNEGTT